MARSRPAQRSSPPVTTPAPDEFRKAWASFDELIAELGGKVEFRPEFDTSRGRPTS